MVVPGERTRLCTRWCPSPQTDLIRPKNAEDADSSPELGGGNGALDGVLAGWGVRHGGRVPILPRGAQVVERNVPGGREARFVFLYYQLRVLETKIERSKRIDL